MIRHISALAALVALSLSAVACAAPTNEAEATGVEETSQDLVSRSAAFETFEGADGNHYFRFVAGNGQNLLRSQGYASASAAHEGVASVVTIGNDRRNFEVREAKDGEFYFNVRSGNGQVVGTSQLYASRVNAEHGAGTVRALIRIAQQEGMTTPQPAPRVERFQVFEGADHKAYFHLRAANGEILLASQGYTTKAGALAGIASVKANGVKAESFEVFEACDGGWAVVLVSGNGEVIAQAETYASKSNATRAVSRMVEILNEGVSTVEG
jgi:uncharacterized protein